MFDDENEGAEQRPIDPAVGAKDKADEFRMHAELFAVFEACRKFDARLVTLDGQVARDVQRGVGKLEKAKAADSPVLPAGSVAEAEALLNFPETRDLSTNDYHVSRRPGEVMIARWIEGDQVESFYQRLQAHFDAAIDGFKEDQRQANEWKQDAKAAAFMAALDAIEVKMAERYLREVLREHKLFVLSTQTADEINVVYLCDYVMGITPEELVGEASAPPEDGPTEADLAWFFKLFSLRGTVEGVERMCFFTYLQKTGDSGDW